MSKYCECGCGGLAPICTGTDRNRNRVKGEPLNFIHGHNRKGKHFSEKHKLKIGKANKGKTPWNKGKTGIYSDETLKKKRDSAKGQIPWQKGIIGENHFNWKGGKKLSIKRRYNKQKNDLKFKLNQKMREGIWRSLKKGTKDGQHWCDLIGYDVKQLKKHLQKTMPDGYSWDDFLSGKLHIDHIVPISVHNFSNPSHQDFQRCWSLSNLQLLIAKENMKKHNKLSASFQPSLAL